MFIAAIMSDPFFVFNRIARNCRFCVFNDGKRQQRTKKRQMRAFSLFCPFFFYMMTALAPARVF